MKAKVIGLINEKGGVGKSTTAATMAYVLAQQGKKVLLIDFDGQGHASLLCGVPNINRLHTTTATLMNAIIDGEPMPEPHPPLHEGGRGRAVRPNDLRIRAESSGLPRLRSIRAGGVGECLETRRRESPWDTTKCSVPPPPLN